MAMQPRDVQKAKHNFKVTHQYKPPQREVALMLKEKAEMAAWDKWWLDRGYL